MGCGVAVGASAITGEGDEFVFADDARADRHFAACLRFASCGQRLPHPALVKLDLRAGIHWLAFLQTAFKQPNGHYRARLETRQADESVSSVVCYYRFQEFSRPHLDRALQSNSRPMTTEASQRGSGQLTTDRVTGRLRQPAAADPSVDTASTQSPAALMRRMTPSEFNTAMIHFYRGEVQRSNTWRNRLDTTTNWAVITAGATLSFVFSSPHNPHFVIPINSILVVIFL